MLSKEDNELLCRVGPGTPMGELLRQYWLPVLLAAELPEPDGRPLRTRLLGEDLVAFRDTDGQVGLLAEHCPHRGASLYFGRNEEAGLRCVYHGWKFDTAGRCTDMPNEPAESNFKDKVRARAYPTRERNGVIWAYLGPRNELPPLPEFEWAAMPPEKVDIHKALRECNWVQGLEGDIDTAHLYFLHSRLGPEVEPQYGFYHPDRHPHLELVPTEYGVMYGARRSEDERQYYWRITQFMLPCFTYFPPGGFPGVPGHVWVPLDDEHTMVWSIVWNPFRPLTGEERATRADVVNAGPYLPATSDPLGRWRFAANKHNDYLMDADVQRRKNFTGIGAVILQDQAITESMGPVYDRSQEHLGTTDAMVIQVRKRLLDAARALRDQGTTPPGVDNASVFAVRSASLLLPRDADWIEATRETLRAFGNAPVACA